MQPKFNGKSKKEIAAEAFEKLGLDAEWSEINKYFVSYGIPQGCEISMYYTAKRLARAIALKAVVPVEGVPLPAGSRRVPHVKPVEGVPLPAGSRRVPSVKTVEPSVVLVEGVPLPAGSRRVPHVKPVEGVPLPAVPAKVLKPQVVPDIILAKHVLQTRGVELTDREVVKLLAEQGIVCHHKTVYDARRQLKANIEQTPPNIEQCKLVKSLLNEQELTLAALKKVLDVIDKISLNKVKQVVGLLEELQLANS